MSSKMIKNALIYDGTGSNPYKGSILINGDFISSIFPNGCELPQADICIDADGLICTPGFIDIHRHADYALFETNFGLNELSQGLTTVINGNCGMSGAPLSIEKDKQVFAYQEPIIGKVPESAHVDSFDSYSESVSQRSPMLNTGCLVGLGTIAAKFNGISSAFQKSSLSQIQKEIEKAVCGGAIGVSLGLGYKPAFLYDTADIIDCLESIKGSDIPVSVHMRQEGDEMLSALTESISIAKALHVPLEISHLKAIGRKNWHCSIPKALDMLNRAVEEGVRIGWDVYPYTAGSTQLVHVLPPEISGHEAEVLSDNNLYANVERRISENSDFENIIRLCGYENIYPGNLREIEFLPYNGLSIAEGAKKVGIPPLKWLLTILSKEKVAPSMLDFITCEDDIITALKDPYTSVISDSIYPADGNYHPRVAGTYTRIIEKYVLQENALSLQEAIRKMTAIPASRMGLKSRGMLKQNYKADICVFDPSHLKETAVYGKPLSPSVGMKYVLINGKIVLQSGEIVNAHAGRCL